MPHSVSSQDSSANRKDDELLPDAPPAETASENQEAGASAGVKLEDLFNDDDDDEFPASSAPDTKYIDSSAPEPAE